MIRLSLQAHCFPSLHPPAFLFSVSAKDFNAPFANNSHYTSYVLFSLSFISLLFSFRTSFAAFFALLPCENPCMQAHDSPPIADSWMTSSLERLPSPRGLLQRSHPAYTKPNAPLQFVWGKCLMTSVFLEGCGATGK